MQNPSTPASSGDRSGADALVVKAFGWLSRAIGAVFFGIGLFLALGAVTALRKAVEPGSSPNHSDLAAVAFFGLPAALLLTAGLRLLLHRPNKFKSLFRPLIWYLLCSLFVALAFAVIASTIADPGKKIPVGIGGVAAAVFLGLLCHQAGSNASRRVNHVP